MLSIAKVGRGREAYYLATVAGGRARPGGLVEPDGYWLGIEAALLGLVGTAEAGSVRAVMSGRDPVSGRRLAPPRVRVAGFDCTFSTPKSVSLLHALGEPGVTAAIEAAHGRAVGAVVGYLERHAAVATVASNPRRVVGAAGLVACAWPHRASRAPDPHLHTHVVVANLVRVGAAGDERWRPLDARQLYGEARVAGAMYEAHLRHELTVDLGLSWSALRGAWADVAGIDRRVVRAFSRRAAEIEQAMAAEGLAGPRAARVVADNTRPPKLLDQPYEELVASWRERSFRLGVSASALARAAGGAPERHGHHAPELDAGRADGERSGPASLRHPSADAWEEATLASLLESSPDGSFTRRQALAARCAAAPDGITVRDAERQVDELLRSDRVITAAGVNIAPGALGAAPRSDRRIPGLASESRFTTAAVLGRAEQVASLAARSGSPVVVLGYEAGGRLATLDALAAWRADPAREPGVVGLAPGARAAAAFEAATGIDTTPVASRGAVPAGTSTLVVADAHRFGALQLEHMVRLAAERGSALALVAPDRAVAAHPALAAVARATAGGGLGLEERPVVRAPSDEATRSPCTYAFPGVEVSVASSGEVARALALTRACELSASRRAPVVLVAGDVSVVAELESLLQHAPEPGQVSVVHARSLEAELGRGARAARAGPGPGAGSGPGPGNGFAPGTGNGFAPGSGVAPGFARHDGSGPAVVCIGGAGVLQRGSDRLAELERFHIVLAPGVSGLERGGDGERPGEWRLALGRAAEAGRPLHLTRELGAVPVDLVRRAAWWQAASAVEAHRARWGITEARNAFGSSGRDHRGEQVADRARVRREVAAILRGPERTTERGLGRAL